MGCKLPNRVLAELLFNPERQPRGSQATAGYWTMNTVPNAPIDTVRSLNTVYEATPTEW